MANRVAAPTLFAPQSPNWSLAQLDANAQNATGAINDSSLGAVNGPLADTGSVNAYAVTCSFGTPSAYQNGMTVFFNPANTNTGASTLIVSPLASLPIVSTTGTALTGGEIVAGSTTGVVCDGSAFRIFSVSTTAITQQIWSTRLRSYNAISNPGFEVDQRLVGASLSLAAGNTGGSIDRWIVTKNAATAVISIQQVTPPATVLVPGTNFEITSKCLQFQLTTAQATLAAGEYIQAQQVVEGPFLRELINDVHSVSVLARCTQPMTFTVSLATGASLWYSLTKLCQITTAGQWQLFTLPNLPLWAAGGTWPIAPGNQGYALRIGLGAGSTYTSPANDTWQSGANVFVAGPGTTNFASLPTNTQFWLGFVQHEPGPNCTTLIDCPFATAYDSALRYYQKTYPYTIAAGATGAGGIIALANLSATAAYAYGLTFQKPMARTPTTLNIYDHNNGTLNSIMDQAAAHHTVTGVQGTSEKTPFYALTTSGLTATTGNCWCHYTADTGW